MKVKDSDNEVAVTAVFGLGSVQHNNKLSPLHLFFFSGTTTFSCKSSTALCPVLLTLVVVIHTMLVPVPPSALS